MELLNAEARMPGERICDNVENCERL